MRAAAGFTDACDCRDDAAPYEPCECCGTPVARYGLDYSWVEDDMQRGCPVDSAGVVIGHCRSWTTHTPRRCRTVRHSAESKEITMRMRRIVAVLSMTAGVVLGSAAPAFAHQHLSAPSGDCPADSANVPQGSDNPAGQTPGGRNNAAGNEQGSEHCTNR